MRFSHPRPFSILLFVCLAPGFGFGADRPKPNPEQRKAWVVEQIQNLNSDSLRERFQAERALLQGGPEILPLLPAPELLPNAAVQQAVRRIRLKLKEAKARASVKPSRVTLSKTATLTEILADIQQQTGNPIDADKLSPELRERQVQFEVSDLSFWDAMDQLAMKTGVGFVNRIDPGAEQSGLQMQPSESLNSIESKKNVGAFRIEVTPLKFRPLFGEPGFQLLRVPFRLATEPRLRPLFLKLAGKDFSATKKNNDALRSFNPDAKLELPLGEGGNETSFPIDFLVPDPFQEQAIQLSGKAVVTVAADSEEIAFTNLSNAAGTARRRGGVTVTLDEVTFKVDDNHPHRQTAKVRVIVNYDTGGPAFETHRSWIFHNRVFLKDAEGRRVERNSDFHTALQTDGGVIVEYNFDKLVGDAGDYSFTYVAPTLIINVPVEFDFPNLAVPQKRS